MLAPSPPTETEAFSFSNASFSSARLRWRVPRISIEPAKLHAVSRLVRLFSSPQCSVERGDRAAAARLLGQQGDA